MRVQGGGRKRSEALLRGGEKNESGLNWMGGVMEDGGEGESGGGDGDG